MLFKNQKVHYDKFGNILLAPIITKIKNEGGLTTANHSISYYSPVDKVLVFVGKDPIDENSSINIDELD
jgi:hypothetical protein